MTSRSSRSRRRSRADTGWFLAGYAGLAGFFVLEALNRRPGNASSLKTSDDDQGTTRAIITAYGVAADLPLLLRRRSMTQLPRIAGPAGLMMQVAGLTLRTWSMRTLGTAYTRTLRTEKQQDVIDTGPYRLVRHPGYTGSLLTWTGFALASRSVPVVALVSCLLGWAYRRRILAEEQLLQRNLPGYRDYQRRTTRLIPYLW